MAKAIKARYEQRYSGIPGVTAEDVALHLYNRYIGNGGYALYNHLVQVVEAALGPDSDDILVGAQEVVIALFGHTSIPEAYLANYFDVVSKMPWPVRKAILAFVNNARRYAY